MDTNTTSVETRVSAALLTSAAPSVVPAPARLRSGSPVVSATMPRVDDQASSWQGNDLGFGHDGLGHDDRCGFATGSGYAAQVSAKQMKNNSIEFQIRLGPPCSPPV